MNRYQWQANSAIAQVAIRRDQAYPSAFIVASDTAPAHIFAQLPEQLRAQGLVCMADTFEGKPALRVTGFTYDQSILETLKRGGYTDALPTLTERDSDKPFHLGGWIKEHSVAAAGLTYLVADAMAYSSGILRGDTDNKKQGLFFAATSALLVLLGTPNPKRQMERIYDDIDEYLTCENGLMHEEDHQALHRLEGDQNILWRLSNFLSDHLVTINNVGQGVGGFYGLKAGMNQKNPLKSASGVSIMAGQWGALGIKEDPTAGMDRDERAEYARAEKNGERPQMKRINPLTNPMDWLRQKPLRLTGIGAGLHNILTFSGGVWEQMDMRKGRGAHQSRRGAYLDMGAQGVNLVANTLYGLSPKDRGGALKVEGYVDEVTSMAAQIFAHAPEAERALRIQQFAGYISGRPELKSSSEEISETVLKKVEAMQQNPWHRIPEPERVPGNAVLASEKPERLANQPLEIA